MQDFPVPALPMTKNLNRKSEKKTINSYEIEAIFGLMLKSEVDKAFVTFSYPCPNIAYISFIYHGI